MCGRYSIITPVEIIARLLEAIGPLPNWPPRYNVAPAQLVPVVRLAPSGKSDEAAGGRGSERELAQLRWGLVPFWSKDPAIGAKLINARAETVAEKPAFRAAFRARRCLVPADSFYEWGQGPRGKRPYRIGLKSDAPDALPLFAFAGLWDSWEKAAVGEPLESCTIVTTEANELLRPIHHRMPVILFPADYAAWLDPATPDREALALLKPYPAEAMMIYPVSARVNGVRFDDAACIAPAVEQPTLL